MQYIHTLFSKKGQGISKGIFYKFTSPKSELEIDLEILKTRLILLRNFKVRSTIFQKKVRKFQKVAFIRSILPKVNPKLTLKDTRAKN